MANEDVRPLFIGRKREIQLFKEWLTNGDPDVPQILYLYDELTDAKKKGGVGKTWLLRLFSDMAKEIYPGVICVFIDFFNINNRDGVAVAEHIIKALKDVLPTWDTSNSEKILAEYNDTLKENKEDNIELRNRFADALIEDFRALNGLLQGDNKHLLVFFDTYENIQENPLTATLRLDQVFPDDYDFAAMGFIIAGRYELDWNHVNWLRRENEVQTMAIAPFTLSEIEEFLEKRSNVAISFDPDEMEALYERTGGRPILIGLVSDVLNQRVVKTLKELVSIKKEIFEASLVAKINDLEKPIDQVVQFMAHAYHRFNFDLLNWISNAKGNDLLQGADLEQISQQLLSLTFVRRPSEGTDFVLHDEMRPLVNKYCWAKNDPDRSLRKDLSQHVIDYYDQKLKSVQSEQLRQAYIVEQLYHKLYVDLASGYRYFTDNFAEIVNLRLNSFARALLREVQPFKDKLSPAQRYSLKFSEARLLLKEETAAKALSLFLEVEQEADQQWLDEYKADLSFEKGWAYQELSRYSEAIEAFTKARDIAKDRSRYATMSNWLGGIYRRQGQLETALRYYDESLTIHKDLHNERAYATTLLSISMVYSLQGKLEEALLRAQTNLRVRNKLFKEKKISKVYLGNSLTTIAYIYFQLNDFTKAEEFFQEAEDLLIDTGNKRALATLFNRQGELSTAQGHLIIARDRFKKAYRTALGVDTESQITSLNKQGWIMIQEGEYQRAVDLLQQAVELAAKVHNYYEQAESLIDLAEALKRFGRDEESQQASKEARNICQQYKYHYLLGLSYASEGDVLYDAHEYQEAFRDYGEACFHMTQYNDHEYDKGLRKVINKLFDMPPQEIDPIVDELVTFWTAQGLEKMYPKFVSSCQEVKSLMSF
jgi:tetratricopeptide (TPR) repeat protein